MISISTESPQVPSSPDKAAAMGGLPFAFVIIFVECQKHWLEPLGLIYLVISCALLLLWIGHLAAWPGVSRFCVPAVNGVIATLLAVMLLFWFNQRPTVAAELAATLLFWTPLLAAWWAWTIPGKPHKPGAYLLIFFTIVAWQSTSSQGIPEHLLLSVAVAAIVHHVRELNWRTPSNAAESLLDPLTGLATPACFEAELAHVAVIADRYRLPMTLIGWQISPQPTKAQREKILSLYTDAIIERMRTSDTACRWDENTLMILLPNTSEEKAAIVARNIEEKFLRPGSPVANLATRMTVVEHQMGEDPMSTLSTLESKLAAIAP